MRYISKMAGIDPKILVGIVLGIVIVYMILAPAIREGFSASGSGSDPVSSGGSGSGSISEAVVPAPPVYADIVTSTAAPNATAWACFNSNTGSAATPAPSLIARIGNDGYVECFNKDGAAGTAGCSFMSESECSETLSKLVAAGANQKELLAAYVKKYNDPRHLGYSDKANWLYRFCNANASVCIKAVAAVDPNLVPKEKCGSYVSAPTPLHSAPAAPAADTGANTKRFGRDATKSKPALPTPSPSLSIPNLISTVRSLASQITGISTDSAEIRRAFVDAYGSAKMLPADDNNQILLIYTNYTTFYNYFYGFLDDKNQRIFRNSPFEIQAEMINLINQFDTQTLMVLLLTIDPSYEFETEEEVVAGAGAAAGAAGRVGAAAAGADSTSMFDLTSIKESIIRDIKNTLKDVKCPPGPAGGSAPPPAGGSGSGPAAGPGPAGPTPLGASGSTASSGSKAPLPLKDIFGPIGGSAKGSGADGSCTPTPTCQPAPQACQAPPTSCPVCSGAGCDVCAGSGSPSLGQGSSWYTMMPSNNKPTWTDATMMWGR